MSEGFPVATLAVILLGIGGTTLLHLAKAMQRQGIQIFDQIRAKVTRQDVAFEGKVKKPAIYIVGLAFNNMEPLLLIVANVFVLYPALYTSMFGIGLVILLVYSAKVLHEPVSRQQLVGSAIIIAGTLLLGIEALFRPAYEVTSVSIAGSYLFIGVFSAIGLAAIVMALKTRDPRRIGISFGMVAGGFGGMDIAFKLLGQVDGGGGGGSLLPVTPVGWVVFMSSFAIAIAAFGFTQWGFARKAPANVLVPAYDSLYVVLPVVYQMLLLPGYEIWLSTVLGIAAVIAGIVMVNRQGLLVPAPVQPAAG